MFTAVNIMKKQFCVQAKQIPLTVFFKSSEKLSEKPHDSEFEWYWPISANNLSFNC